MPLTTKQFSSILSILLSGATLLGCQPDDKGETVEAPMCSEATDCDACLQLDGCNWTSNTCEEMCLQDASCSGPDNPASPICPDSETGATTKSEMNECEAVDDCAACLNIEGCNWTSDLCSNVCLQDTSCYGPGNPSAPICPE